VPDDCLGVLNINRTSSSSVNEVVIFFWVSNYDSVWRIMAIKYPVVETEGEDAIHAKKVANKAWFHNKADSSLHSRYAEARKSAALTVKKSEIQCWENFVYNLDSNHWQASTVFWHTIRRLRGKRPHLAVLLDPLTAKMVSYSATKNTSFADGDLLNPVTITPSDTQEDWIVCPGCLVGAGKLGW